MANSTPVSTCPLFPDLENDSLNKSNGVYTVSSGAILPTGIGSGSAATAYTVSYDGWNSTALRNYEFELHEKYPALQQAWEHYQNILRMCKSREEETGEDRL